MHWRENDQNHLFYAHSSSSLKVDKRAGEFVCLPMTTATKELQPREDLWDSSDHIGEALHFLRMTGVFYTRSEFTAPWGLDLPPMEDCMMFHVVTSGSCWLVGLNGERRLLQPGSFTLVPHGEGHRLLSEPGIHAAKLFDLEREQISDRYEILRHGAGGEPTRMVCGAVKFDHPAAQRLVQLLPTQIVVDAWQNHQLDWIHNTLRLMASEAEALRPGGETIVTRLADILVIQAIRSWITDDPAAKTGWLGALQDRQIGRALLLIHRDPENAWTVAGLASEVAMSRSAFAARFSELVGETPMQYVRRWKMLVAVTWLKDEGATVSQLAARLGYDSEAAFSRAFKRVTGVSPGSVRRAAVA